MANPIVPLLNCPAPDLRPGAQGIVRVAVDDGAARLIVTFATLLTLQQQAYALKARSYTLTGGTRLFPHILSATPSPSSPPDLQGRQVVLQLDGEGDFSIYTLSVSGPDIDPYYSSYKLRFRLGCDDPFDCRVKALPSVAAPELPVTIDYLAKDYASFRQALLDFIPTRLRDWTERSEADIGMMLLELFAATADTLSYSQDRVANEAFLGSASQRRSVAGHLALIGYQMDEGVSATTWLQFQVNGAATLPADPGLRVATNPLRVGEPVIVFETLTAASLLLEHNTLAVYTWGNKDCCLPRQALTAALYNPAQPLKSLDQLRQGDYLLFDDGHGHRDVVRLVEQPAVVPADPIKAKPDGPLTVVRWSQGTPLHYDYCAQEITVRGNLVLATHGETVLDETLRDLDAAQLAALNAEIAARKPWQRVPRQRLPLSQAPLAHLDPSLVPQPSPAGGQGNAVAAFTARSPRSISTLTLRVDDQPWQERTSLLGSRADDQVFRVEIDDRGDATVVFGDGIFGQRPDETAKVTATYRVGGGTPGNVGADSLIAPQPRPTEVFPWLVSVTNPLPAKGGRDLESGNHARRFGPAAFQTPLVAVTTADYQAAVQGFTDRTGGQPIQRANAAFRWTGSWLTATLAVDPRGAEGLNADLRTALLAFLDTRRLAGYDLEVLRAIYLPIELAIAFCLTPGYRAGDVEQALEQVLSNGDLPGGGKGFFHPDNFSFGDNLYVSQLYETVMAVPGVESAQITRLSRLRAARADQETDTNLRQGYLPVGADQIIRLDNDRDFPENGTLAVRAKGGA